jgi:RNA polymerase sigma-70 factor (ECF subfamily)
MVLSMTQSNLALPDRHAPLEEDGMPTAVSSAEVGRLFRENNRSLVRFLNERLGSEQEAKEIAQEAYVKLLQLERTGAVSFMRAYLFKIAANLAIDRIRQRRSRGPHENIELFPDLEDGIAPERKAIAAEEVARLVQCIEELPERCAEAFMLHRFDGLTSTEVGAAMGISDRMVRKYLVRAVVYCRLRVEGCSREEAEAKLNP